MRSELPLHAGRRAGLAAILSIVALSGAALAQSPSTSPLASAPAASAIASAAPSTAPGQAGAETCATRLSDASITAVTGQAVPRAELGSIPSSQGFPATLLCSWVLADGGVVRLDSYWEMVDNGFGAPLYSLKMGPENGGAKVAGLPQPANSVALDGVRSLEWSAYAGAMLTETLILQATTGDGDHDDLDLLTRLAQASVAQQAATAATIDPVCAAVLGTTAVSSERLEPASSTGDGLTDLLCGYDLGDGSVVQLALRWSDPAFLPNCCEKVKGLGAGAWAQQSGSGKKAPWRIDWIAQQGDPTRVATLRNSPTATKPLSKAALIALAGAVTSDATPGSAPSAEPTVGPAVSVSGDFVGDWILTGVDGPPVTASFAGDGTSAFTVACPVAKGKKAPSFRSTYTVAGDQIDVVPSGATITCKKAEDQTFVQGIAFALGIATHPGTWAVVGDTLTITNPGPPITLTFTRATSP